MSSRTAAALTLALLGLALAGTLAVAVPWRRLAIPPGGRTPVSVARDFTAAQIASQRAFHRELRPASYASLALGLLTSLLLGGTPLGARVVAGVARPLGGGWGWRVVLGVVVLSAIGALVRLPPGLRAERILRRYGLSTQTWAGWARDRAKGLALGTGLSTAVLLGGYALIRAAPTTWWAWAGAGGAALVATASFLVPVLIEPAFNSFAPLPAGELRTSLLELARQDQVPVRDILVADASRRTTALNAYVSGIGSTRRLVVFDTLVQTAPAAEVRLVVAHELGHAKRHDVAIGTLLGGLGVAAAAALAYLALSWPAMLRRAGVSALGDGTSVPLLLALAAVGGLLSRPGQSLLSRRIEARADVHSLDLTGDAAAFIASERRLAATNLSDLEPHPLVYAVFFTHPSGPQRIAMARDWARLHPA